MNNKEFAVRLLVLERRANDLVSEIQELFQEVLDAEQVDSVE